MNPIKWLTDPPDRVDCFEPIMVEILLIGAVIALFFLEKSREQFTIYTLVFFFYSIIRFLGYHHHIKYITYIAFLFLLIYLN